MPDPGETRLALENDGRLALTFVGSGSAFSKRFYQTNLMIVKGPVHLLVDCGTKTPEALFRLGLSVTNVKNFLITHSHADHIGGLEEVMLINRYGPKKKANIIITREFQNFLWENSLKGGAAFNECHKGRYLRFEDFWVPLRPAPYRSNPRMYHATLEGLLDIKLFRTKHIPDSALSWEDSAPSYGIIIDNRILFTSDTRYDPDMVLELDAKYHFEQIFHDCQLFTGGVHASIDELSELPASIKERMYLVHYQDSVENQLNLAKDKGFAGFVQQWKEYAYPVSS